ncbi:ATP-binding protein [Embleya sp. MST-111070]|uniref:ATP-binding protein n=1 Tax=Embleya sp. MST-111070 TaxID=3398231 RepID=UPI003F7316DD
MRNGPSTASAPRAVGCRVYTRSLPSLPESAREARRLVTSALAGWGLVDDGRAVVVVTELMSNAHRHAATPTIRVGVRRMGPRVVRVFVVDRSDDMPMVRRADTGSVDGRGLTLVDALSEGRWGVEPLPVGKRVWAEVTCSTAASRVSAGSNRTSAPTWSSAPPHDEALRPGREGIHDVP